MENITNVQIKPFQGKIETLKYFAILVISKTVQSIRVATIEIDLIVTLIGT